MLLIYLLTLKNHPDGSQSICGIRDSQYYMETTYPDGTTKRETITEEEFNSFVNEINEERRVEVEELVSVG